MQCHITDKNLVFDENSVVTKHGHRHGERTRKPTV